MDTRTEDEIRENLRMLSAGAQRARGGMDSTKVVTQIHEWIDADLDALLTWHVARDLVISAAANGSATATLVQER